MAKIAIWLLVNAYGMSSFWQPSKYVYMCVLGKYRVDLVSHLYFTFAPHTLLCESGWMTTFSFFNVGLLPFAFYLIQQPKALIAKRQICFVALKGNHQHHCVPPFAIVRCSWRTQKRCCLQLPLGSLPFTSHLSELNPIKLAFTLHAVVFVWLA